MKTIQANEMTDEQWQSFARFNDFLKREIYPQFRDGKNTSWEGIKIKHLNKVSITDSSYSNSFYIIDENEVIAFIDAYTRSGKLYFNYNYYGINIRTEIIKQILLVIKNILAETNKSEASYNNFHERNYEPFLRIGADIVAENLASRLLKKDIDFLNLKKITDENKYVGNYELKLYRDIPVEIHNTYVDFIREATNDMNEFHPNKIKASEYSMNDLLINISDMKNNNNIFYMFIIFDKENIAALCSARIYTIDTKPMIDHTGCLTSAGRNYRGKGFAKYLKAKLYLKIREDFPDFEYIFTDTYPWNKYMYRINEEFGFKPYQKGYKFRFTREYLEKFLTDH